MSQTETLEVARLSAAEKRGFAFSAIARTAATPLIAVAGVINTAIVIAQTGATAFGLVSLVATMSLLLPFADLGVGAALTTAVGQAAGGGATVASATYRAALRRTSLITLIISVVAVALGSSGLWPILLGQPLSYQNGWFVSLAFTLFGVSVPLGLGTRILIGLGRNDVSILIGVTSSLVTLAVTVIFSLAHLDGLQYAISGMVGLCVANGIATVVGIALARRVGVLDGVRLRRRGLLAGSVWMLTITVAMPLGLQWGRLIVSHVGTATELSQYALAAQFYAICWGACAAVGAGLWPVFVRRRDSYEGSLKLWRTMTLICGAIGVVGGVGLITCGSWLANIISAGEISPPVGMLAGFALLLVVQSLHLPSGMLLTTPGELRWQAICIAAMAIVSVGASLVLAPLVGVWVVATSAGAAVLICCFIPDLVHVRTLLRRRGTEVEA